MNIDLDFFVTTCCEPTPQNHDLALICARLPDLRPRLALMS
ncbi:MAG TPA: hypothetical protein PL196_02645 [Burkholderiaceae bacterium]|nr:hypothetical protein [Burkholderiaceae bacterium]